MKLIAIAVPAGFAWFFTIRWMSAWIPVPLALLVCMLLTGALYSVLCRTASGPV